MKRNALVEWFPEVGCTFAVPRNMELAKKTARQSRASGVSTFPQAAAA